MIATYLMEQEPWLVMADGAAACGGGLVEGSARQLVAAVRQGLPIEPLVARCGLLLEADSAGREV
jgi:hypothetical protein